MNTFDIIFLLVFAVYMIGWFVLKFTYKKLPKKYDNFVLCYCVLGFVFIVVGTISAMIKIIL